MPLRVVLMVGGWRELKVLPVSWYDGLARILTKVEDTGVWPDGLLDAYIAMIPKNDGNAISPWPETSLVRSRLFIVFGLLLVWVRWMVGSSPGYLTLFSVLEVVVDRLKPGILLALDIEEDLSGAAMSTSLSLMLSSPLTRWIGVFWIVF